MSISDFIESSNKAVSPRELFGLLVDAASREGFEHVAYGALSYVEPTHLDDLAAPAVAVNYPIQWCERYFEQRYDRVDPVVSKAFAVARPFLWAQLGEQQSLTREQRRVLDEAREAGLKNGISVPLHGPWGRVAVVSFASSHEHADPLGRSGRLYALASQFHVGFGSFAATAPNDGPGLQLSDRERECLQWSAMGKSSWDIGAILHISENTATFHIKNAMKKLGTSSRTVAVVRAIRLNLIDLAWAFRDTAYPG